MRGLKNFYRVALLSVSYTVAWLRVVYALFGSLASFVKNYSACCSRHSAYVFSIDSYHALNISSNHCDQTKVSSLKDFSKNPYTFTYFCHQTAIYSFSNWFIQWRRQLDKWGGHIHIFVFCTINFFWNRSDFKRN